MKRHSDLWNGALLGVISVSWLFLIFVTSHSIKEYDPLTVVRILSLIAITAGVYVAIWKLFHDHRWQSSETYLEECKGLYEKAFESFSICEKTHRPLNSRLVWLNVARLLLSAENLQKKILFEPHIDTLNEYAEYWRMKFYQILDPNGPNDLEEQYFYEGSAIHTWSSGDREPIDESSIAVIYHFIEWPDGRENYLENVAGFTQGEIERMERFGPRGFAAYCRKRRG